MPAARVKYSLFAMVIMVIIVITICKLNWTTDVYLFFFAYGVYLFLQRGLEMLALGSRQEDQK